MVQESWVLLQNQLSEKGGGSLGWGPPPPPPHTPQHQKKLSEQGGGAFGCPPPPPPLPSTSYQTSMLVWPRGRGEEWAGPLMQIPACVQVIQCRNPQLVGREGVVIKDSTTTAHLGGPPPKGDRDREPDVAKVYHVPKSGTTFTFLMPGRGVDPRLITILGETLGRQPSK